MFASQIQPGQHVQLWLLLRMLEACWSCKCCLEVVYRPITVYQMTQTETGPCLSVRRPGFSLLKMNKGSSVTTDVILLNGFLHHAWNFPKWACPLMYSVCSVYMACMPRGICTCNCQLTGLQLSSPVNTSESKSP